MNIPPNFFSALGGAGFLAIVFGFICKALFKSLLDKDVKLFEQNLVAAGKRKEIKFQWFHAKQAKVIAKLYGMFADLHKETVYLREKGHVRISVVESEAWKREGETHALYLKWYETDAYFKRNLLFFDKDTGIRGKIFHLIDKFRQAPDIHIEGADNRREAERAMIDLIQDINTLKDEIEAEFLKVLEEK